MFFHELFIHKKLFWLTLDLKFVGVILRIVKFGPDTILLQKNRHHSEYVIPKWIKLTLVQYCQDVEATPHGQHLTWITYSSYQCTMDALKTVQYKRCNYRNILVKVGTGESVTTSAWAKLWRTINWCEMICSIFSDPISDDLVRAQWHFTGLTCLFYSSTSL